MSTFSYQKDMHGVFYPIVELILRKGNYISLTTALVDSGATISIFKTEVAKPLNLNIRSGKEIFLHGVGGRIQGYIHELSFEVGQKKVKAPVVFSYEYLVSVNLLGREGIFKHFRIIFEEKNLRVKL